VRRIGIDKPLFRPGPAVNDSWPPDRIFNGLVMMRRLGQRVVRAQGLDQPGMNDLGILAELRLEDGDAHEAAAKWIETPPGNPADQPKRITALSETVAMLVTKIGDAIAHLPGAEKVFRRGLVARNPAELASALGLAGALISGEMSREVAERMARACSRRPASPTRSPC